MDARGAGFGYLIPMPRFFNSRLGDVTFIDEQGTLRTTGNVFDDAHFKKLVHDAAADLDRSSVQVVEPHPSMTVAVTSGCVEVKALSEEELSQWLRAHFHALISRTMMVLYLGGWSSKHRVGGGLGE
jgi:hypothetical protein